MSAFVEFQAYDVHPVCGHIVKLLHSHNPPDLDIPGSSDGVYDYKTLNFPRIDGQIVSRNLLFARDHDAGIGRYIIQVGNVFQKNFHNQAYDQGG